MGVVVDDTGGNEMPVVCLPMLGTSRVGTALAFGPALAGGGSREVYLDLPGHGDAPGEGAADSQTILDTVCDWLQRHLQRPALLAGASYGAYLAAGVARQRPDLVEGLLLVCPGVRVGAYERELPDQEPPAAEQGWLVAAPPSCTDTWTAPSGAAPGQSLGWCCRPWPPAARVTRHTRTPSPAAPATR